MLLTIEFGKLFRRKFNYLFLAILILMNFAFVYKLDSLSAYFDISIINTIFNIILKVNLVLLLFAMGINYIHSYREDYISKVNVLLEMRKKKSIRDIFALIANLIYFLVYFAIIISCLVGFLFLRKRVIFEELKNGAIAILIRIILELIRNVAKTIDNIGKLLESILTVIN